MQQNYYYIVVDGRSEGPFPKDILKLKNLKPDSLVWAQGMPEWKRAAEIAELADLFIPTPGAYTTEEIHIETEPQVWFAIINGNRLGPFTIDELINMGLTPSTPVWKEGMPDWYEASTQPEIMRRLDARNSNGASNPYFTASGATKTTYNPYANTSNKYGINDTYGTRDGYNTNQYGSQNQYSDRNPYNGGGNIPPQFPQGYTNWLPWAIVATVAGALLNCLGMILGIIAIVQANKANTLMQQGFPEQSSSSNSSAKILCIISFVLSGIGLATMGWLTSIGFFSAFI